MNVKNVSEISFEQVEKAKIVCDNDCSVASLYDLGCLLCNFALDKMKQLQPQPNGDPNVVVTDSPV